MRIVVIGASGFLGRHLLRELANERADTIGVSRQPGPGLTRVATYADTPPGDVLVHLAQASNRRRVEEDGSTHERAALAEMEALLNRGFRRVVYASSAAVYGDRAGTPRRVGDEVYALDAYTRLKLTCEAATLGSHGTVARLANLYGPGMARSNVLSAVLDQLPLPGPIRVKDVEPVRDFLWIEDAARALALMALSDIQGPFNVGTGEGTSVCRLIELVLEAAGQTGRAVESDKKYGIASRLVLDVAATQSAFGWRAATSLPNGIGMLVEEMRRQGHI